MEGKKKQLRLPLKTLQGPNLCSWKSKLKESCYKRVKEDRNRILWSCRSSLLHSSTQKEFIESAFKDIYSDELKKIKNQQRNASEVSSLSGEDDVLWEFDGPHSTDECESEEILLEMQRIFYEDLELERSQKEAERSFVDEEDEYLALALDQFMQLNDGKGLKEQTWCPICKKGELHENHHLIYCNRCQLKLNRGDQVHLGLLRERLAEAHEEHLDRGCRLKPEFCIETVFDLTALYIKCQHCHTFEVVI